MGLQGSGGQLSTYLRTGAPSAVPPLLPQCRQVLLADDEAIVRTVLTAMLRKLGCTVLTAGDGHEALRLYASHYGAIDLVIFDLMLPDMTGEALYAQLRRINPRTRAMLITGHSESHLIGELLREGLSGVLPKPFDVHELSVELIRVLGEHEAVLLEQAA